MSTPLMDRSLIEARQQPIRVSWDRSGNLGDELTPLLIPRLTGRPIVSSSYGSGTSKLLSIGSILHRATANATVWGSGLLSPSHLPRQAPARILAVRGPLTRDLLLSQQIDCPAIYGDPAILMPLVLPPCGRKQYRVGLLPHYADAKHPWVNRFVREKQGLLLRARKPAHDVAATIQEMCRCDVLITSSLHGLILADTYGIPNVWVSLTQRLVGGRFKFHDYFASLTLPDAEFFSAAQFVEPFIISPETTVREVLFAVTPPRPVRQLWHRLLQASPVGISPRHLQAANV
ncbi:MAG: polysaccharide pyruvyl transferase family protein [Planctomycetaceae bacterium]